MDLATARASFPGLRDRTFLDAACVSLVPDPVRDAVRRLTDDMVTCPQRDATEQHIVLDRTREDALREIGRLLHAPHEDVALVESTSHALNIVARGLTLRSGDKILMPEIEFMGAAVPWIPVCKAAGAEIELVPRREGRIDVERLISRCTDRTRAICISSVEWTNGFRVPLEPLGEFTRRKGILLIVDAIQQLGTFELDVDKTRVDAVACGGHKWLNAPFGRGFLYLHPVLRSQLQPSCWSYLNLRPPEHGWGQYFMTPSISPLADYRFVDSAQNFELGGTTNYLGNVALSASLRMINDLGPRTIETHIRSLTDHLRRGLERLGLEIVTPPEPESRSAITTFSMGSPENNQHTLQDLLDRHIYVSVRYTAHVGGVRISTHFFNTREDIDHLLSVLSEITRRRSR